MSFSVTTTTTVDREGEHAPVTTTTVTTTDQAGEEVTIIDTTADAGGSHTRRRANTKAWILKVDGDFIEALKMIVRLTDSIDRDQSPPAETRAFLRATEVISDVIDIWKEEQHNEA